MHISACICGLISAAAVHITADIAAPVTMLPSTVRSGVLSVLNDKNTPRANIEYISPSSNDSNKIMISICTVLYKSSFARSVALLNIDSGISTPIAAAVSLLM